MAGRPQTKERLNNALEEIDRLQALLNQYQTENKPKRARIISRSYDESVIDELIAWSEDGLFLDECLAQWGIDGETWKQWLADHVELKQAVGPARARARASMLKTLREALKHRTAFPVSLADRIIAMVERETDRADASASELIHVNACPVCMAADAQSAENTAQPIAIIGNQASNQHSPAAK